MKCFYVLYITIKILCICPIIRTEKTENVKTSKDSAIKPAKLSRGRAPKPLLPLGRKWGKKAAPATTEAKGAVADEEDESASVEVLKEQVIISFPAENHQIF